MKNLQSSVRTLGIVFAASLFLSVTACSEGSDKSNGGEQVREPVMNSGPETEAERATTQTSDSANNKAADSSAEGTPR